MQSMAASLKHLIDSPASIDGETGSPSIACCRVMDAIAGDCSSSFGERLKIVEAECGFGERCSRGCAGLPPADCSLIGAGRSSIGRVVLSPDTVASGNAPCFDTAGSAGVRPEVQAARPGVRAVRPEARAVPGNRGLLRLQPRRKPFAPPPSLPAPSLFPPSSARSDPPTQTALLSSRPCFEERCNATSSVAARLEAANILPIMPVTRVPWRSASGGLPRPASKGWSLLNGAR